MSLASRLAERIAREGPVTVAAFMDAALYDPEEGYYAIAAQRSGRHGDFFTSVDAGPLFGEVLATFVAWVSTALGHPDPFDLVEAGAGNGRLMRDVLDTLACEHPDVYGRLRVHLVERSRMAREAQPTSLRAHAPVIRTIGEDLPASIRGLLFANELLDALPVHRVRMTEGGLVETFVTTRGGRLALMEGPASTPALEEYFRSLDITLPPGQVADISLAARDWCMRAARSLARGYLLLVDYGHEAHRLFREGPACGTLRSYAGHQADPGPRVFPGHVASAATALHERTETPAWLLEPGARDLTAHVDFTTVRRTLQEAGLRPLMQTDQTRWLLASGLLDRVAPSQPSSDMSALRRRLQAKTLVTPGGPGSTHQVLLFGSAGVPAPELDRSLLPGWRSRYNA
jgi:SAM-dependent MidA family methyltransferase